MVVAVRIQGRLSNSQNSDAAHIKIGNMFLVLSFLSTGVAFWFENVYSVVFWYVMFQETGNALYIFAWMFLAKGLKSIGQFETLENNQPKRTPWHIIVGIISVGIALMWTLILSTGNKKTLVDAFGHQLCWSLVAYYASYTMYDSYVAMSLRET